MTKAQPGKKSLPWDEDPEILKRLAMVEDLILAGYRNTEIANALKVVESTIRRDRERIAALWRKHATDNIAAMRDRSIANLRRIQRLADNEFRNERDQPANLRIQLDAEKQIIQLQGTTIPVEQPISITLPQALDGISTNELIQRAAAMEAMAKKLLAGQQVTEPDEELGG